MPGFKAERLGPAALPELPRDTVDVTVPAVTGRSIRVAAGGDLQAALDAAQPGDEVVLDAGATFIGNFRLRNKGAGTAWITVRSAGTLPPPGTRVTPADAPQMAKVLTPDATAAIRTELGAHHWRLIGLEVSVAPGRTEGFTLVNLGDGTREQNTLAKQAHHLVLDRMYIHGHPTLDFARCVTLDSGTSAVVDSWIAECHGRGRDTQAILGYNGTGPYRIENNFLEGAGMSLMFGGADPQIPGALPTDITIRHNHFFKPRTWDGVWAVKNSLEFKIGKRVLVEGNVFENSYHANQAGVLIVLKTVNQDGTAPWSETSHVTVRYNVLKGGWQGIAMAGLPEASKGGVPLHHVLIEHNLITELAERAGYTGVYAIGTRIESVADLTIRHNSMYGRYASVRIDGNGSQRLTVTDNILAGHVASEAGHGYWDTAVPHHAPSALLARNLIITPTHEWRYHNQAANWFAPDLASAGINSASSEWQLPSGSPFARIALDGAPAGVNLTGLRDALRGVAQP